ncbi:MAG: NifB/NifX family molybdenum-iron cluster-binding protein [Thomasclavelia sp.]|nr:NifB/NifX family molybdenum-iron cluster-binding protein [Thomasclavelia sp.]
MSIMKYNYFMSRPTKKKIINKMPSYTKFKTINGQNNIQILDIEEYEVIRLIDYLGYNQEECSNLMNISRTSVVSIYKNARKKIARFIIEGNNLQIDGGEYEISINEKGENKMKLAVTCVNDEVFQHFGHCPSFLICDIEDGKIMESKMMSTNGAGCQSIAGLLSNENVDTLICGGIGGGAINHLKSFGINVMPGASGNALKQVESFINGNLDYDPNAKCEHHEHDENHQCHSGGNCHN